jgi:Tfp pilus assembly protein PilO
MAQPADSSEFQRFRRYYQRLKPFLTKQKNSQSTAAIFSLLAVSLFGWYAIRPTAQTILFLRREIADKTSVNQKMEDKITSLIEAQATYEAISEKLPLVDEAIPVTPEAVELAAQLQNLASISGASVSAIQVQSVPIGADATPSASPQTDKKEGPTFGVTAVLDGSYAAISSFMNGIITLRRITTINLVSLRPDRGAGALGAPSINLVIKLTSYYKQQ